MKPSEPTLTAAEMRAAARIHKQAARERLTKLRVELREALAAKKARMRELVDECKHERIAVRGAIFGMRESALADLRNEVKAARLAARDQRAARLIEARSTAQSAIAAARAALLVARQHEAEQQRITGNERKRKADIEKRHAQTLSGAGGAPRSPKLEKLRPLLERVRTIRPAPGESKVEALWSYAKAHPEEMHAILEPKAEQAIAKTKEAITEAEKSVRAPTAFELKRAARIERLRAPTAFELKRAARIEGLRARSEKLRAEAEGAFKRERVIGDAIPMGQPMTYAQYPSSRIGRSE